MADAIKLTKRSVDAASPAATRYIVWDTDLSGFGLRVEPSGVKSFIVRYRPGQGGRAAPKRFFGIGRLGALTPEEARQKAKAVLADVARGGDPAGARETYRSAISVSDLVDRFMTEHVETMRKRATATQYRHVLGIAAADIGSRKAEEVTKPDVLRLHHKLRDRPFLANRMIAAIGSMYVWANSRHLVPEGTNPATRVEKYHEDRRERFLSNEELDRLGAALRAAETVGLPWSVDETRPTSKHAPKAESRLVVVSPDATAAIRLLLLTGARLREILHLRWEHVDLERGLLLLPDSKTGRKTIILNAPAMTLLADVERRGPYVFPGDLKRVRSTKPAPDERPRSDLKRPWQAISRAARLDGVRLHDLRHTHASFGAGAGLGLPIIGKLLGHTQSATTARYAHLDADPLRRASDKIGSAISAALAGAPRRSAKKLSWQ